VTYNNFCTQKDGKYQYSEMK